MKWTTTIQTRYFSCEWEFDTFAKAFDYLADQYLKDETLDKRISGITGPGGFMSVNGELQALFG